jgi:hypothetical protein
LGLIAGCIGRRLRGNVAATRTLARACIYAGIRNLRGKLRLRAEFKKLRLGCQCPIGS